jgi:hypothetical protein
MEHQFRSKYLKAAYLALEALGGGPITSGTLINAIVENNLLENRKCLYHNVLRRVRQSELFDTSTRGWVSLAPAPVEKLALQEEPPSAVDVLTEIERSLKVQATPLGEESEEEV